MGKFINRYNNYNCIKRNDTEDIIKLSHYTSVESFGRLIFKILAIKMKENLFYIV